MDEKISLDLLLAYFNSRYFWNYVESRMQMYGGKYGMVKLSLLKKHRIPKDFLFPDDQTTEQIKTLNHRIAKQKLRRHGDKRILDDLYAELDSLIGQLMS